MEIRFLGKNCLEIIDKKIFINPFFDVEGSILQFNSNLLTLNGQQLDLKKNALFSFKKLGENSFIIDFEGKSVVYSLNGKDILNQTFSKNTDILFCDYKTAMCGFADGKCFFSKVVLIGYDDFDKIGSELIKIARQIALLGKICKVIKPGQLIVI